MEQLAECSSGDLISSSLEPIEIPGKLYFRTGEVARLAAIEPYVLRFWESEFPTLGPKRSDTGHRLYRRKDVEMVLEIKRLLYEQRFTIAGARQLLESKRLARSAPRTQQLHYRQGELFHVSSALLVELRRELLDILLLMEETPIQSPGRRITGRLRCPTVVVQLFQ